MLAHPNTLANLRPWKPGQSGNPAGRARGSVYISECLNALLIVDADGRPKCTKADLERIVTDDNAAPAMVIAARRILSAMRDGKLPRGGADPEPGRDFDRIEGKPALAVHVTSEESTTIRVVLLDRTASPTHKMVQEIMGQEALKTDEPKKIKPVKNEATKPKDQPAHPGARVGMDWRTASEGPVRDPR